MRFLGTALAATVFVSVASLASAAPLPDLTIGTQYNVMGGTGGVFGPGPNLNLTGSVTGVSGTIYAGLFKLEGDKLGDGSISYEDFVAFCITLNGSLNLPDTYTVADPDPTPLGGTKVDNINRLWNGAFSQVDTAAEAAAFQLSLWELDKETTNPFSISDGNFKVNSGFASAISIANTWLGNITSGVFNDKTQAFAFLERGKSGSQDLLTPIPLPAAGLMLFGALGALGFASRRGKASAEA
jgi:hypothetical protein